MTEVLETRVSAVTVFQDGARVTRTGTIRLAPGRHTVRVGGITGRAYYDSFRVHTSGPARAVSTALSMEVRRGITDGAQQALHKRLAGLKERLQAIDDEIQVQEFRHRQLEEVLKNFSHVFGTALAIGKAEVDRMDDLRRVVEERLDACHTRLLELRREREEVEKQIDALSRGTDWKALRDITTSWYALDIDLTVEEGGEIGVGVTYHCDGAQWAPAYDLDIAEDRALLKRIALVTNDTMEPWEGVRLTVSMASTAPVEAVQGTPLVLHARRPTMPGVEIDDMFLKEEAEAEEAAPPERMMAEIGGPPVAEAEPEVRHTSTGVALYTCKQETDIPADGNEHPVTLTTEELPGKTVYYWYADGMSDVVAQTEVVNGDSAIIPGKMRVYVSGEFVGETWTETVRPRESFRTGTRRAYDVTATKEMVSKEVRRAGIVSSKVRYGYRYRLTVTNHSDREAQIDVYDRVPHSRSPAIEVRYGEGIEPATQGGGMGVMHWEMVLPPRETQTIEYDFEVVVEEGVTVEPPLP